MLNDSILEAFMVLFVFTLLKLVLRNLTVTVVTLAAIAVVGAPYEPISDLVAVDVVFRTLLWLVMMILLLKKDWGLLALAAAVFADSVCRYAPLSLDPTVWYAQGAIIPMVTLLGLGIFCVRTAPKPGAI